MSTMREIGGYIELDTYTGEMLHGDGVKLNCGRNALAYIIRAKGIKKILMPKFMCNSCDKVLADNAVEVEYYSIGVDFKPVISNRDCWLYIVNFYGQLSNEYLSSLGNRVIVDNAQAYFQEPISGIDTLYTCRKFFGVPDGAILYTDKTIEIPEQDESFERMHFLLGRYERSASEFYSEYVNNNHFFRNEPIKRMSKLTDNLLRGINYESVRKKRTENFSYLHEILGNENGLNISIPDGAFMYPFYIEQGEQLRKYLQEKKIFVPVLWPNVIEKSECESQEWKFANNIVPIPVDQRYGREDMEYICRIIKEKLHD